MVGGFCISPILKSGPYPTPGTPEFTNASIAQSNTFLTLDRCQLLWFEHQE